MNRLLGTLLPLLFLVLDRITKFWAQRSGINYVRNPDLFFLKVNQSYLVVFAALILVGLVILRLKTGQKKENFSAFALLLTISGGVSNLYDRLVLGYVVDWIPLFSFSVFNLADAMLTVGVVLYLLNLLRVNKQAVILKKTSP